jgi:gamma-glutamyl phosphate reductase
MKIMDAEMLLSSCTGAIEYLNRFGNPHCAIVITQDAVRLTCDEIGIPLKEKAEG